MIELLTGSRQRLGFWRRWHPYVLSSKGLTSSDSIGNALLVDVANSLVAANELSSIAGVDDLVEGLSLPTDLAADIVSRTVDDRSDHLGFRVHAPMDVYLEMLPQWTAFDGWELVGTKRCAPSARFQERVGSSAEMAQVWLRKADASVELELFDIHTPFRGDVERLVTVSTDLLDRGKPPPAQSWDPFRTDDIWHYGILLATLDDVAAVHRGLTDVAARRSDVSLRNDDVVVNMWHGSHHTKVFSADAGLEIEFLSYIHDWGIDA